jgi:hypothetical protein
LDAVVLLKGKAATSAEQNSSSRHAGEAYKGREPRAHQSYLDASNENWKGQKRYLKAQGLEFVFVSAPSSD